MSQSLKKCIKDPAALINLEVLTNTILMMLNQVKGTLDKNLLDLN